MVLKVFVKRSKRGIIKEQVGWLDSYFEAWKIFVINETQNEETGQKTTEFLVQDKNEQGTTVTVDFSKEGYEIINEAGTVIQREVYV